MSTIISTDDERVQDIEARVQDMGTKGERMQKVKGTRHGCKTSAQMGKWHMIGAKGA